ncbi:uncharacterized protein [Physcomitrium patens]|uniref:OVATE domain-containing protein n=1 Tax=Physcomitrium patens TaxID=3218 RepID=A0A2K1KB49_PHYPA|nr:uncharacterized protein LOC112285241 [Physcomitrium patens]XP_024381711.1 uncharacterized protein LOC112285241 [Physcomitrium patens]XP_024381712.1 uncharacterized protein LOC112285241 [Physcomitrium patens]PNR51002.1 hypothetical protein PHYPA_010188 [Physcomitrium patens]|eukprot:XP_024381710.1 uncharacterized protein LOC112285241 [Physcomitrella patens]
MSPFMDLAPERKSNGVVPKVEQRVPSNSRSIEASRSDKGSSACNASKPGEPRTSGGVIFEGIALTENGSMKKKRTSKFLIKQFGIIDKPADGSLRRNLELVGKDYVFTVSEPRTVSNTYVSVQSDANSEDAADQDGIGLGSEFTKPFVDSVVALADSAVGKHLNVAKATPIDYRFTNRGCVEKHRWNVAKLPIELDFRQEERGVGGGEVPVDSETKCSPRNSLRVGLHSNSGNHSSSEERSPTGSERLSFSQGGSPRSEGSVLSIPETVMSSPEHGVYSDGSVQSHSRMSPSSVVEWSSQSFETRGELGIGRLTSREDRIITGNLRRSSLTNVQPPTQCETQALDNGADGLDSRAEIHHETTSASSESSVSRRSLCCRSGEWVSEDEDSDGVSNHERRAKHRSDASYSSYSSYHGSQSRSRSTSSSSTTTTSGSSSSRGYAECYDRKPNGSSMAKFTFPSRRTSKWRDGNSEASPRIAAQPRKHRNKKGREGGTQSHSCEVDDMAISLDSITPQEATAVFHDEVARMMLEEGQDCGEAHDVEEFLQGYMSLRSPFYLSMVDNFFRAVCVDCYKRPLELPVGATPRIRNRSGSSLISKSLRRERRLAASTG